MSPSPPVRWVAEIAGTAALVGIGTGSIVAAARAGGVPQAELALAWLVAVLVPVLLFVRISGAHLNPAVSLALAVSGRIGWAELPGYVAAQCVGALAGSFAVREILGSDAHLGATVPTVSWAAAFAAELAFTAVLVAAVFPRADRGEGRLRWRLALPALAVAVSTFVIGPWTGSSLNPARSIAPALLASTYTGLWIYLVATPLAAVVLGGCWRPRAVDREDRGPGRRRVDR